MLIEETDQSIDVLTEKEGELLTRYFNDVSGNQRGHLSGWHASSSQPAMLAHAFSMIQKASALVQHENTMPHAIEAQVSTQLKANLEKFSFFNSVKTEKEVRPSASPKEVSSWVKNLLKKL